MQIQLVAFFYPIIKYWQECCCIRSDNTSVHAQGSPAKLHVIMKGRNMKKDDDLICDGVTRRDFLKTCATVTAMMGLPFAMHTTIAEAVETNQNPAVIWLHFQECTGCSESLLRSSHPTISTLI